MQQVGLFDDQNKWLDEPDKEGWWWCLQNEKSDYGKLGKLAVAYVYADEGDEEEYPYPFSVYFCENYVGYTGRHWGDLVGKWYGPIEPPPGVDNIKPF